MLGNDVGLQKYHTYFTFVVFTSLTVFEAIATSALTLHFSADDLCVDSNDWYFSSIRRALAARGTCVHIMLVLLFFL